MLEYFEKHENTNHTKSAKHDDDMLNLTRI